MTGKISLCLFVIIALMVMPLGTSYAERKSAADLLKEGLLGAGAGAVGGAASGAKGGNVWKGALAGAGVNILGGALLDSISGEKVEDVRNVDTVNPRTAYSDGYEAGYANGYKKGYMDGFKDGLKESAMSN
ncbi:MAG: hypothetical protein ABH869_05845 [Candidatus Omnitrophota bacterium]